LPETSVRTPSPHPSPLRGEGVECLPRGVKHRILNKSQEPAMPRIPDLVLEKLSPEQRRAYDAIVAGPRGRVVGPLRVWLESPQVADVPPGLRALFPFVTQ